MTATFLGVLVQKMNEVHMVPCTWSTALIYIRNVHPLYNGCLIDAEWIIMFQSKTRPELTMQVFHLLKSTEILQN